MTTPDDDEHRLQDQAPVPVALSVDGALAAYDVPDAQAAHGTSGDGRLISTKQNSGALYFILF